MATVELLINNNDAKSTYGIYMGEGFLDALTEPLDLKEFISNESRLEHGKRVIVPSVTRLAPRELTLDFVLVGINKADFAAKKRAFLNELYKGPAHIAVPGLDTFLYRLIYTGKGSDYATNLARTFGHLVLKFIEPDPSSRSPIRPPRQDEVQ